MPNDPAFAITIASLTVAALLLGGLALAVLLGAPRTRPAIPSPIERRGEPDEAEVSLARHQRGALRVLWWLGIAGVLIGVGASGAFAGSQLALFVVGGAGVVSVLVFHELLPDRLRAPWLSALEGLVALGLVTAVVLLTGYASSPFLTLYVLVVVAGALSQGARVAIGLATLATAMFVGLLWIDPRRAEYGGSDLLGFGLHVGSLWLLAYLASIFAVQQRRMVTRAIELSRTDPLTGLFNRAEILTTLEREVRRTRRSERGFCLLMIDLDGLKRINDSLGHHRGDAVLSALASVIGGSIRAVDSAYRYGGDEFMVLLPETDFVGAFVVAEKIRAGAEELGLALGGDEALTSVSIGLVSHPEDGLTADELMIAADRAMYHAKSQGKNQISGNPRPRQIPALPMAPVAPEAPAGVAVAVGPAAPPDEAEAPVPAGDGQPAEEPDDLEAAPLTEEEPAAMAADVGPGAGEGPEEESEEAPEPVPIRLGAARPARPEGGDEEPDPSEVRRQIAVARRSFDPDDQIRRAMDAFLSTGGRGDRAADQ
jgi:diguanylate cyclase (GGDEF)-like protein